MKSKLKGILFILILSITAFPLGFISFASAGPASSLPAYDAIDLGPKIRKANYKLDLGSFQGEFKLNSLKTSSSVGDIKIWMSLNDAAGYYFLTYFTLVYIGVDTEIWVQNNYNWPSGDPRDPPVITYEDCVYLVNEFESNIYPKDTAYYGAEDFHDGTYDTLDDELRVDYENGDFPIYIPEDYWDGEKQIILVSNIRDENYYDSEYPYFIAGFYSHSFEEYFDRNIISIDTNEWDKRVGPGVEKPYQYEALIAHEFQHLLHDDHNPSSPTYMNEACSMYAEILCGYPQSWSDINSYLATPDNSLTEWGDQGGINILADYGAAFLWGTYLNDQFDPFFLGRYNQAGIPGREGIEALLPRCYNFDKVFHNWRIANLIHSKKPGGGIYNYKSFDFSDDQAGEVRVYPVSDSTSNSLKGTDFGNTITILGYDTLVSKIGPYGTDYFHLQDLEGLNFLMFDGDDFVENPGWFYDEVKDEWYSGDGDLWNSLIAGEVYVDELDPTLYLTTYWDLEDYWDFGFVQVSEEGDWESEWISLENEYTTSSHAAAAHPNVIANLPGLTSWSGFIVPDGIVSMQFDLSEYAGKTINIGFRYVSDWAFTYEGWYILDAHVGSETNKVPLSHVLPKASFMVTLVEKSTLRNGKSCYHINDMHVFSGSNFGIDLALISKFEDAYLIISPTMPIGMADYEFKANEFKFKHRCF